MSSDEPQESEDPDGEVVDPWAGLPGDVGDDREKFVRITLPSGEEIQHSGVYFRYTDEEFIIAPSMDFNENEISRYHKSDTARVEILQHHPKCFITTAVAENDPDLQILRGFRDNVLRNSLTGRFLIAIYDFVSPSVARTLARSPESRLTTIVRWFVHQSAILERHRLETTHFSRLIVPVIVVMYSLGLVAAICGTGLLRLQAAIHGRKTAEYSAAD